MTETPKDRANDGARIIDLDAFRRAKITKQMQEEMGTPGPMHPAARALAKKKAEESKNEEND